MSWFDHFTSALKRMVTIPGTGAAEAAQAQAASTAAQQTQAAQSTSDAASAALTKATESLTSAISTAESTSPVPQADPYARNRINRTSSGRRSTILTTPASRSLGAGGSYSTVASAASTGARAGGGIASGDYSASKLG